MRFFSRLALALVVAAALVAGSATASADDILWTNAAGGSFQDSGNWSAGVPTATDVAIFDLDETYEVSFADDSIVKGANVKQGDVTWDLGEYSIVGASNSEFHVGKDIGEDSQLTIAGGTVSGLRIEVARRGGTGSLCLTDSSSLHAGLVLSVGREGMGELRIDNGASANASGFLVGGLTSTGETGTGKVVVSGIGTSVSASNMFLFDGSLQLEDGARLELLGISGGGGDNPLLTATGAGTTLVSSGGMWLGDIDEGPMTAVIEDGAKFESANTVVLQSAITIDDARWFATDKTSVQSGGVVTITGDSLVSLAGLLEIRPEGTVNLNGGTLRVGSLDNQGTFNWNSGTFELTGVLGLTVGGGNGPNQWEVQSGQTLAVNHNVQVADGGALQIAAGGTVEAGGRVGVATGGALELHGGTATATEIALEGGVLSGNGQTAGLLTNAGRIEPGFSPGLLSHDGDFAQLADGLLEIELAGIGSFDALAVTGDADLDGTLEVTLLKGYVPQLGDSFEILTAASVSGAFANLSLPTLRDEWRWSVDYAPDGVTLAVAAVPEPISVLYGAVSLAALAVVARRRRATA